MAAAFAPTPGEVRWQRIGGVAPPADADVDSDHAHSAQAPHGPPDNPTSAEPGSPAAGREDALHAWYGDTLGRVHGQMSAELERLRDELARVKVSHDQHDRRVQERSAEQLAVCHCDAFATLEAVLDPIPPLLHRLRGELELDSQHAEERREQMDEMMQGAEFARPPTGSAQSDELGADAEWREWLGGLRRVATVHAEGSAASRAALDESLRAAERALASATMDASAQARALLAVVTSFPADQASLAPLYAAATAARAERAHWEKTARELDEQLRRTERQLAHVGRQLKARADEARLNQQNAERLYAKVKRSADRHAKLEAQGAEAAEDAAKRERALEAQLARAREQLKAKAKRAEAEAGEARQLLRAHTPQPSYHLPRPDPMSADESERLGAAFGHLTSVRSVEAEELARAVAESEASSQEARFEAQAEKELRSQLQRANDSLRAELHAAHESAAAHEARVAELELECEELRIVARTAEAAGADAEARAARLAAVAAARDAHESEAALTHAPYSGAFTAVAPRPQPPPVSPDSQPPASSSESFAVDSGDGGMQPLVELLCAALDATGSGRVSEDELTAFLATVDTIEPLGHSPRIKARALCREFGDSRSIGIDAFRTILSKLAEGDSAKLLRLVSAVVKAGLAKPPLTVAAQRRTTP